MDLLDLQSNDIIHSVASRLNVSIDIAKIIAKWYAEEENPNGYTTISEYVEYIADSIEYQMNLEYLNEGMEGIRDISPEYAQEFQKVADALGIDIDFWEDDE